MTFADLASLVVAYSDLIEVQDVIKAMDAPNPNLPNGHQDGQVVKNQNSHTWRAPDEYCCQHRPLVGPPAVVNTESKHPTESPATTHILRSPDTYEPRIVDCCDRPHEASPFPPIWRTLPPITHETVVIRPKVFVQKVDLINKGSLIDLFL